MEGGGTEGGKVSMSELRSGMPGHCSILCSGKFTLLAAALLDSLGYYQMAESTLVVWKRSIKGERQRGRETIQQRGRAVLPGPGLSSDIYNKRLTTQQIYWNPLPSLTSQFC